MNKFSLILVVAFALIAPAFAQNAASTEETFKGRALTLRDFGSDDLGFLSLPDTAPTTGVLIVHDSYGLNNNVRRYCDAIAARGHVALAVDLYNGKVAEDKEKAIELQAGVNKSSAKATVEAGIQLLTDSPLWKTEHIVVVAFGRQCEVALNATNKPRKNVNGMVWIEPEGEVDDTYFKRSNLPLKIVAIGKQGDPDAFLAHMETILSPEKRKLVFVERYPSAAKGFFLSSRKAESQNKANASVSAFWKDCAEGKYQDQRNVFQKWLDKLD